MKKTYKRKTYRFSHSVVQGGYLYAHRKTSGEKITDKEGLANMLKAVEKKFGLIDTTIKIYDHIFFYFFMRRPSVDPADIISTIQKHISAFGSWDASYVYTTVYDLQEGYIRKLLKEWGFEYDEG